MRLAGIYALLLAATACGTTAGPAEHTGTFARVEAGDTVWLDLGETVELGGDDVRVTFAGVAGDSRCPANVTCVWAGDAHVRLDAVTSAATRQFDLHTGIEPHQAEIGGFTIRLIDVEPAPIDGSRTEPQDYSVRLAISRG